MKIINKTAWRTDQIRALIYRIAKDEDVSLKNGVFRIIYGRTNYIRGYAYYGLPPLVTLKLHRSVMDTVQLAFVIAHELAHSRNVRHRQMSKTSHYKWTGNWKEHFAWAKDVPIEKKIVKTICLSKDIIIKNKLNKCLKMVDSIEKTIKRRMKALKKWKRKTKYYEKQIAACSKIEETIDRIKQ